MATTITRYVNTASGGGDGTTNGTGTGGTNAYAGLRAALDAEYSNYPNLVSSDVVLKFICEGSTADDSASTYTAPDFTTDSTRYLWVVVEQAYRHAGKYDTGKYRFSSSAAVVAVLTPGSNLKNLLFEGVQFVGTHASGYYGVVSMTAAPSNYTIEFRACVFHTTGTATSQGGQYVIVGTGTNAKSLRMVNCAVSSAKADKLVSWIYSSGTSYIYNCTLFGGTDCLDLFGQGNSAFYLKNNILERSGAGSCILNPPSTWGATAANLTDDTTSPDGASYQSKTAMFVDEANFDLHLAAGDTNAKNNGTDLSADGQYAFSTDIDGVTRSGTWDIGADEYVSASAGIPVYMNIYRQQRG